MTFKMLLTIKAVVCLVFGLLLLLVPSGLFDILGASLDDVGRIPAREYGAAMLGTLVLTWLGRTLTDLKVQRIILLDLFVYDAVGFVVTLLPTISGTLNALGWGIVAVYLFFTVGSGYLLMTTRAAHSSG
ncbi:MAG: hypothetical protein AB1435_07375 [Chloroflexota bacterium]|jgi:hypothetical protein